MSFPVLSTVLGLRLKKCGWLRRASSASMSPFECQALSQSYGRRPSQSTEAGQEDIHCFHGHITDMARKVGCPKVPQNPMLYSHVSYLKKNPIGYKLVEEYSPSSDPYQFRGASYYKVQRSLSSSSSGMIEAWATEMVCFPNQT